MVGGLGIVVLAVGCVGVDDGAQPDPSRDSDADRIVDEGDRCPNDPETYNGLDDADGCPDEGRAFIQGTQIVIADKIYFEPDSDEIQERSRAILEAVAATADGRWVAQGMMFHMPGRWQLVFDVERGGRTERLATDVVLE